MPTDSNAIKRAAVMLRIDGDARIDGTLAYLLKFPATGKYYLHMRVSCVFGNGKRSAKSTDVLLPKVGSDLSSSPDPSEKMNVSPSNGCPEIGEYEWVVNLGGGTYSVSDVSKATIFKIKAGDVVGFSIDAISFTAAEAKDDELPDAAAELVDDPSRTYRVPLLDFYDPARVAARLSGKWSIGASNSGGEFEIVHQCTSIQFSGFNVRVFGMPFTMAVGTINPCEAAVPDGKTWEVRANDARLRALLDDYVSLSRSLSLSLCLSLSLSRASSLSLAHSLSRALSLLSHNTNMFSGGVYALIIRRAASLATFQCSTSF